MSLDDALKILGLDNVTTDSEVKKAYKRLLKKYHPDVYARKSLEEQMFAEKKSKEINVAYECVMNHINTSSFAILGYRLINEIRTLIDYSKVTLDKFEYNWFYYDLKLLLDTINSIMFSIKIANSVERINVLFKDAKSEIQMFYENILEKYMSHNNIFDYDEKLEFDCSINDFVGQLEKIKREKNKILEEIKKETSKYELYAGYEIIKDLINEIEKIYEGKIKEDKENKKKLLHQMLDEIENLFIVYFDHKAKLNELKNISLDFLTLEEMNKIMSLEKLLGTDKFLEEYERLIPIHNRYTYKHKEDEIKNLFIFLQNKALKEIKKLSIVTDISRINIIKEIERFILWILDRASKGLVDCNRLDFFKKITFSDFCNDMEILREFKPVLTKDDIYVQRTLKEEMESDQVRWLQQEYDKYCIYSVYLNYVDSVQKIYYESTNGILNEYYSLSDFFNHLEPSFFKTSLGISLYEYSSMHKTYYCF